MLLEETLHWLAAERGGLFVDCTLGLGGHAHALLSRFPGARLLGIDQDPRALALARERGAAMVDLLQTYETAGLLLSPGELPDFLPALLEFALRRGAGSQRFAHGLVSDALRDIASGEGDLTRRLETQGKDELAAIATSFNQFVDTIAKVLVSIRESSESVRLASTEIASGNQDLSARTEQQAGSLEETAAAMEELTATVQQNAANARQANELATGASQVASHASTVVGQVVPLMATQIPPPMATSNSPT